MSHADVALVMYDSTKIRADHYQDRSELAERIILTLRRRLLTFDPSLPNEYDGTSWSALEEEWSQ